MAGVGLHQVELRLVNGIVQTGPDPAIGVARLYGYEEHPETHGPESDGLQQPEVDSLFDTGNEKSI